MAVQFQPKPGKPHFKIILHQGGFYFWPTIDHGPLSFGHEKSSDEITAYCANTCFGCYKTPGEAARALHYGSES